MENPIHRQPNDTVTVHPNVLLTIARAAALNVKGVARLGYASGTVDRMIGRSPSENGVRLLVANDEITLDIYLVVDVRHNLRETCLKVQQEVSRTMEKYVGMTVRAVNIHIEDVLLGTEAL